MNLKNTIFFSLLSFMLINSSIYIGFAIALLVTIYTYRTSLSQILPDQQVTFNNITDYINQVMNNISVIAEGAIRVFITTFVFSTITLIMLSIYMLYILKINECSKIRNRR